MRRDLRKSTPPIKYRRSQLAHKAALALGVTFPPRPCQVDARGPQNRAAGSIQTPRPGAPRKTITEKLNRITPDRDAFSESGVHGTFKNTPRTQQPCQRNAKSKTEGEAEL